MRLRAEALVVLGALSGCAYAGDWLTWGHDPQRSSWAAEETGLTPANAAGLVLSWKTQVKNKPFELQALTSPIVASGIQTAKGLRTVLYTASVDGSIFALDAETGESLWDRRLQYAVQPGKWPLQGTFLCPNGITATPVLDKAGNTLYAIGANGSLYGFDPGSGEVKYAPVQFIAAFAKSWSLNFFDGVIYTTLSQGCGGGRSGFYSLDVRDGNQPLIHQMLVTKNNTGGIWGAGGAVIGTNGRIYGGAADGEFNRQAGNYSNTEIAVSPGDLAPLDYYLPRNWRDIDRRDLDLASASPVYFSWHGRNLLAAGGKEGVIYLLDADKLGGADHQTSLYTSPRYGNDDAVCCEALGQGIWGGMSTALDADGERWLIVPMGAPSARARFPVTNGAPLRGTLMAFRVVEDTSTRQPTLQPVWMSGDLEMPGPAAIARGVVFDLDGGHKLIRRRLQPSHRAVLKAFDLKTGKEIFSSGSAIASWSHFGALAISDGRIFAVDHDSNVYSFAVQATSSPASHGGPSPMLTPVLSLIFAAIIVGGLALRWKKAAK